MPRPTGETNRRLTDEERQAKAIVQQARASRRGVEQTKRQQILAERNALLHAPLTPGVRLTPKERASIADRVRGGITRQSSFGKPNGGNGRTKAGSE